MPAPAKKDSGRTLAESAKLLDNPATYRRLDPSHMRDRLLGLPEQCERGWKAGLGLKLPETYRNIDHVVLIGMGGSAVAGDLVADLLAERKTVPVSVVRDFEVPFQTVEGHLVVACSYSGNTEETLHAFQTAIHSRANCVAITTGGSLARVATEAHLPLLNVPQMGEPRSAACYVFTCLVSVLHQLGIAAAEVDEADSAFKALRMACEQLWVEVPLARNPAKQLAAAFAHRIPVICGAGIFGAVARRWKNQVNENAKQWAAVELLPELMHNSIEGYGSPAMFKSSVSFLILQPSSIGDSLTVRFQLLKANLEARHIQHRVVTGQGTSPLAQILAALALGDSFSYYLGILNGKDPANIPTIERAKSQLHGRWSPTGRTTA